MIVFENEKIPKYDIEESILSKEKSLARQRLKSLSFLSEKEINILSKHTPAYFIDEDSILELIDRGCSLGVSDNIACFHPKRMLFVAHDVLYKDLEAIHEHWLKESIKLSAIFLPCKRKSQMGHFASLQIRNSKDAWEQLNILSHLFFQDYLKVYGLTR